MLEFDNPQPGELSPHDQNELKKTMDFEHEQTIKKYKVKDVKEKAIPNYMKPSKASGYKAFNATSKTI